MFGQWSTSPCRYRASSTVIHGAGADVPAVEVAAEEDDGFRMPTAADLEDLIPGDAVWRAVCGVHEQMDAQLQPARLHPPQQLRVFYLDGRQNGEIRPEPRIEEGAEVKGMEFRGHGCQFTGVLMRWQPWGGLGPPSFNLHPHPPRRYHPDGLGSNSPSVLRTWCWL